MVVFNQFGGLGDIVVRTTLLEEGAGGVRSSEQACLRRQFHSSRKHYADYMVI